MNFLDIRTVLFSQLITDAVCTAVLTFLWLQNRKRYAGMFFWVVDFIFQTTAVLLIILRGSLPDWMSMGFPNTLVIAGALMGYLGLERFVGKRSSQVHNYILLAVFILVHFYFIFVQPDLAVRNLNLSLGLLVLCFQCAWLMLWRAGRGLTRMTQVVGWAFALFCMVSLIRIFIVLASPHPGNDFFQSGLYDTLILMSYQSLLILLTFGLGLMVNRRLLMEVKTQEEKFTRAFHSSPYAILITRLSDGLILDVNRGFEEFAGYPPSEAIGKTTLDLRLWVKETDHQEAVAELSARGEVQGREFQFRAKSGRELTGLFYAEILVIENEQLILSSISDITEHKQVEEALRHLNTHDALTGLYNRGFFEVEMARLERGREFPISIMMADLDYLKDTNDQNGHAAGDALLKRVAQALNAAFRAEDVVARIGGDEFAVLLPATDATAAEVSLQRVRQVIQENNAAHTGTPIRISLGVSTAETPAPLSGVLKGADANMYREKRGHNAS